MKDARFYIALSGAMLVLLFLQGCNSTSIQMLSSEKFPQKPEDHPVDLYVGKIERNNKPIAILNSKHYPDQSKENKALMLAELREMARKIGADAVTEIKILPKRFEGMMIDENVPFPAWKPGNYFAYFMRGRAVIYSDLAKKRNKSYTTSIKSTNQGVRP